MRKGYCHHCGAELQFDERVFRNDTCPDCDSDVYCCLNCRDYDESAPDRCREPQAERVAVKDRRNFCDYFWLGEEKTESRSADRAAKAREKLEALFKK
jgi:hypothetical protein